MNIEQYKDQEAENYKNSWGKFEKTEESEIGFKEGFNTALELELPIKFVQWRIGVMTEEAKSIIRNNPDNYWKELYTYWLENVFTI